MEKLYNPTQEDDQMNIPPWFWFHPIDEEFITHYLSNKVIDNTFFSKVIGQIVMIRIVSCELPSEFFKLFSCYVSCYLFSSDYKQTKQLSLVNRKPPYMIKIFIEGDFSSKWKILWLSTWVVIENRKIKCMCPW